MSSCKSEACLRAAASLSLQGGCRLCAVGICLLLGSATLAADPANTPVTSAPTKVIQIAPPQNKQKVPVISSVALDPGGKLVAATGDDHFVRTFDLQSGDLLSSRKSHADWGKACAFRPDGRVLATTGDDGRVHLWDSAPADKTAPQSQYLGEQPCPAYCLAYSADGTQMATAGFDDKIRMYETAKGGLLCEQPAPGSDIRALCYSPDGTMLAAAGRIGLVRVYNVSDCSQRFNVKASPRRICALAYSPDGKMLAAAGQQRVIRLLDASTGRAMGDLPERPGEILALCFCGPTLLAAGGSSNDIHVWDITTKQEVSRLVGHTGSITTLAFQARLGTLVSGSYDTTIRLWNVKEAASTNLIGQNDRHDQRADGLTLK